MQNSSNTPDRWLREAVQKRLQRNHRLLFFTAVATLLAVIAGMILQLPFGELAILGTLSLFCWDTLNERINIFDGIENKLDKLEAGFERRSGELESKFDQVIASRTLRTREQLPLFPEQMRNATEIALLLISGSNLIPRYNGLLERKLQENCRLRIILLKRDPQIIETYEKLTGWKRTKADIETTVSVLLEISKRQKTQANCEIRQIETFLPFSIVGADIGKDVGTLVVEFQGYKINADERRHLFLHPQDEIYTHYRNQFEKAWNDASPIMVWKTT